MYIQSKIEASTVSEVYVTMVNFKACPRCRGDLQPGGDRYGEYMQCLQCGHVVDLVRTGRHIEITVGRQKPGRPAKSKARASAA